MPGDRLALAVLVSREQELVGVREPLLERVDDLLLVLVDDVERLERMLDVDTQRAEAFPLRLGNVRSAVGEVANMADARLHGELAAEVAGDGPRFRRALDDDQPRCHRRDTLAMRSAATATPSGRYCDAWHDRLGRAGSTP